MMRIASLSVRMIVVGLDNITEGLVQDINIHTRLVMLLNITRVRRLVIVRLILEHVSLIRWLEVIAIHRLLLLHVRIVWHLDRLVNLLLRLMLIREVRCLTMLEVRILAVLNDVRRVESAIVLLLRINLMNKWLDCIIACLVFNESFGLLMILVRVHM